MTRLEADEMNQKIYLELKNKYFQKLPNEKEYFIEVLLDSNKLLDALPSLPFPNDFFEEIFKGDPVFFREGDVQFCAIIYEDNEGDFIVLASAVDQFGKTKLTNLIRTLSFSLLGSLLLIFITGRYYAERAIHPLLSFVEEIKKVSPNNLKYRIKDSTDRNEVAQLTKTFNQMMSRLETSFEIQQNFIGNASHELKNPLAAILGITEVALIKDRTPEAYRQALEDVQKEANRLEEITRQLLQLARVTSGESKGKVGSCSVLEVLETVIHNVTKIKPDAKFQVDCPNENLEDLMVSGNESLLNLAFYNVLDNAVKFSDNKLVSVQLSLVNAQIELFIKDSGIGISQADLSHIFEPFFRGDNTRLYKGYGIGLPLSRKIIELHGGSLEALENQNEGACFRIVLPKNTANDK
jgi:signal transduction histidine kinase